MCIAQLCMICGIAYRIINLFASVDPVVDPSFVESSIGKVCQKHDNTL